VGGDRYRDGTKTHPQKPRVGHPTGRSKVRPLHKRRRRPARTATASRLALRYNGLLGAEGGGEVFVDEEPGFAVLFPDAGITDGSIDGAAVLHFDKGVHGDGSPGDGAVASDSQVFVGGKRKRLHVSREKLVDAAVIFFPAGVRERRYIVEDQVRILGVILGGVVGIAGAPGSAVAVDQFSEGVIIGGFLLRAGASKGDEGSEKCE
jgi:hypothetical protein